MGGTFYIVSMTLMLGAFMLMVHVKTDVQVLSGDRWRLQMEQVRLKEDIKVLKSEYAHLARPGRLKKYAEAYKLEPIKPSQVMSASFVQILSGGSI